MSNKIKLGEHTRGPWRYEAETKTIRSVPANYWLASMDSWDGAVDSVANARLIAAAPELLEALKEARQYAELKLEGFRREYSEQHAIVQTPLRLIATIDSAIAKAEGRS